MTLQIDRLMQFLESDFSRALALLRTSALMAEDLRNVAQVNRARLTPGDRRKIAAVVRRVYLVSARANEAAGRRAGVVERHGNPSESRTLPHHARRSAELDMDGAP